MRKLYKCIAAVLCLSLTSGCSGGSIYSNYRETEQLMVVQSMGFDRTDGGYGVSVSSGSDADITRMSAEAESITLAEQRMQDFSAAEELFYAHTNYIVIGSDAAKAGISHYLDFIGRSTQMRLDTPLFVVTNGRASKLILGSGNEAYDATDVLGSLHRNLTQTGELRIFTAGEVTAQLCKYGGALICAVKITEAGESLYEKDSGLTALPAGYAVIVGDEMAGQIDLDDAIAVGILQNKSGPLRLEICGTALQLDDCDLTYTPITENGALSAVRIDLVLHTALLEKGDVDAEALESALENDMKKRLSYVLNLEKSLGCDFLGLGGILEAQYPLALWGMGGSLGELLPELNFIINVSAELDRSFDADREDTA